MKSFLNIAYWVFGLGFAVISISIFSESILIASLMLIASVFILPPVQKMNITGRVTPEWLKIGIIIALMILTNYSSNRAMEENFQKIREDFNINKATILSNIETNIKNNNVENAFSICKQYSIVTDNELQTLCAPVEKKHAENEAIELQKQAADAQIKAQEQADSDAAIKAQELKDSITFTSASAMCSEFGNNEVRANGYYKDKLVEVGGRIAEISVIMDSTSVILESGNDNFFGGVVCSFENDNEIAQLSNFNKGDFVYVLGNVDGFNSLSQGVEMSNCKIYTSSKQ